MKLSSRQSRLGTETAFETLAKAKKLEAQGKNIVHLEIGEPDFDSPSYVIDAAKEALDQGFTHYGPSAGQPELRNAIAIHQGEFNGYSISPENVIVTPGGKPVMFFSLLALIEEGDEVIYPNPGFPIYESMINYSGGTPIPMKLEEAKDFNANIDDLKKLITDKTKMMIINSPNNPCGSVTTKDDLEQIAEIAIENNIIVLSDEIYKDMYYEGEHYSITKFNGMKERTIILDGFSKSYAMTGWRLGYGIFPDFLVEDITKLMTNSVSCTSVFSQMAAIAALEGSREFTINMMEKFKIRRDIIVNGLNSIEGVTCRTPLGAFYAFPNISGTGLSSSDFADIALNEYGVALLSGTAFGEYGDDYIRISFANSEENLLKAIDRLNDMIKKL
ncbi:MAG: aspartate aminotransferase [Chloroflexi bacterium]|nr:aspartate aminotransferase [Chloroflexota bacterium]|tara:strand:- start:24297 stop:25460 length:1164 start_codon:yes stop_codon:yes gene_type:complete